MNQLPARDRGELNVAKDAISGTPGKEEDWTLDMTGNWTGYLQKTNGTTDLNQTRTQNAANEITTISTPTTSLAYDKNGNMKTVLGGVVGWWTDWTHFHYDAWNRPVEVRDSYDAGAYRRYSYDALNRRVQTVWNPDSGGAQTYRYYYNAAWQLLEEHYSYESRPETYDRQYVWGLRYIDEPILRDRNSDGDPQSGDLGFAGSGYDERLYAMQDANFNVVALADTNGDVVERVTYSAYGVPTFLTPAFGNRGVFSDYEWALLFTGQLRDWALATYNYRNRDYCPNLGRFVSRDPAQSSPNLYAYCDDDPLNNADPTGMANISAAALACARQQLKKIKPPLSPAEIEVRMEILESLASTSGASMGSNGSCQDWANCTILNACGVTPSGSYSAQADKCTDTTYYTPAKPLDPSCLKPGDQIHFVNPYFIHGTDDPLENGCNTFVVGKDCRGILLYNRWARCVGGSFVGGKGVMSIDQYCMWMATWPSVNGGTTPRAPHPEFPINRVRCPLPPKAMP